MAASAELGASESRLGLVTLGNSEVVMVEILRGLHPQGPKFFGGADSPSAPLQSQLLAHLRSLAPNPAGVSTHLS